MLACMSLTPRVMAVKRGTGGSLLMTHPLLVSSWPGIAVRRTASLPLAYVPAIHVFLLGTKDVDARHKAGHDEGGYTIRTNSAAARHPSASRSDPSSVSRGACSARASRRRSR